MSCDKINRSACMYSPTHSCCGHTPIMVYTDRTSSLMSTWFTRAVPEVGAVKPIIWQRGRRGGEEGDS